MNPAIGRFLTEDAYWNPGNMIYGDNPQKINEHQDPMGLNLYTYVPDVAAIKQSGNLYTYCGNNPLLYVDENGEVWWVAIGAIAGAAVGAGLDVYKQMRAGADWNSLDIKSVLIAAGSGAASGALGATSFGLIGQIVGNTFISGTESITRDILYGNQINMNDALLSSVMGAVAGAAGGSGLQKGLINPGYNILNVSQKYFYVQTMQYIDRAVAETMAKEFAKGLTKGILYEILMHEATLEILYQISK